MRGLRGAAFWVLAALFAVLAGAYFVDGRWIQGAIASTGCVVTIVIRVRETKRGFR